MRTSEGRKGNAVSFRKGAAGALVHWFTNRAKFEISPPSLEGPFRLSEELKYSRAVCYGVTC